MTIIIKVHNILTEEILLILPNFPKNRNKKRGIVTSLVTGFIQLACEGILSYLHNKRQKALKIAFMTMENQINTHRNKFFHLEDSVVMYGIYNLETLEKLFDTVHKMHNKTTWNQRLFAGKLNYWYQWYLTKEGVQHYAINSLLYITTMREKYVRLYEKFISELKMYANVTRILSKGYLPISLLPQMKLEKMLSEVKKVIQMSNPAYHIIIKWLQLVTFGINTKGNLIV